MRLESLPEEIRITKSEILAILSLRDKRRFLKKQMDLVDGSLRECEQKLIERFSNGALVDEGYDLYVRAVERRYPAWKEHFISQVGKEAADEVLKSTAPRRYFDLIIKIG